MERWKAALKRLLWPGWGWVTFTAVLSGVSLYLAFGSWLGETPFAYAAYTLSAYGLTVLVAALLPVLRGLPRFLHGIPFAHRWLTDKYFAVWHSMAFSFAVNLGFAALKLVCAVRYRSVWEGGLAVYNLLLCVVRLYLLAGFPKGQKRLDHMAELRRCRVTGWLLLLLNAPLALLSTLIVLRGNGYHYPGTLVYAVALHAFYSLILAVVNTIRYRRSCSPVLSAAKAVDLATALVSIFNLETALLSQFGREDETFRLTMTACTAFAVCVLVLGGAVYMITRSGGAQKNETRGR